MSTYPVSNGSAAGARANSQQQVGDLAFAVAILQMEMIDGEIAGRLTTVRQINEVRKAYSERIAQLNELIKSLKGDKGLLSPDRAKQIDLEWDPAAGDGAGAVVGVDTGKLIGNTERLAIRNTGFDPLGRPYTTVGDVRTALAQALEAGVFSDRPEMEAAARSMLARASNPHLNSLSPFSAERFVQNPAQADILAQLGAGVTVVKVTKEQINAEIDRLRGQSDGLSADTEIRMLELNRLLNRRNQTLQLTSNFMSSVHQSAMGIINNIKV